jgi:hypothetical protein
VSDPNLTQELLDRAAEKLIKPQRVLLSWDPPHVYGLPVPAVTTLRETVFVLVAAKRWWPEDPEPLADMELVQPSSFNLGLSQWGELWLARDPPWPWTPGQKRGWFAIRQEWSWQ